MKFSDTGRGRRHQRHHREVPARAAVQRPAPVVRPAEPHRAPPPADAADHAEAPQGERGLHVARSPTASSTASSTTGRARSSATTRSRSRSRSSPTSRACPKPTTRCSATGCRPCTRTMAHKPLEFLYERFSEYIEDRRREPRNDILTGLATATFPDGSTPEVSDAALIAANLFAGGQETTVRLLSFALRMLGERPDLQKLRARRPRPHPQLHRGDAPTREPAANAVPHGARPHRPRRRRHPRGRHGDARTRGLQPRPAGVRGPARVRHRPRRTPASTSRSATASTPAPARRWPAPRVG